jgi:hypothetical protein
MTLQERLTPPDLHEHTLRPSGSAGPPNGWRGHVKGSCGSGRSRVAGEPDRPQAFLIRTDSPGLLLVHLHAAGLGVGVVGLPRQGWLRVRTTEPTLIRSVAADLDVHLLQLLPLPAFPLTTDARARQRDARARQRAGATSSEQERSNTRPRPERLTGRSA